MTVRVIHGDCREALKMLPDRSVQMCVTSPPYYGLRDYGTGEWEGGDAGCDHGMEYRQRRNSEKQSGLSGGIPGSERDRPRTECKCGAIRVDRQIGIEPSPDAYVVELVAVFREVRRVLRDDGVMFLNLGDSYASGQSGARGNPSGSTLARGGQKIKAMFDGQKPTKRESNGNGVKPKDLLMIPAQVALALRADGWYLRSDVIWVKPNPMPESVKDRPTSAHEHVFLLAKSARYYWDGDAVREAYNENSLSRYDSPLQGASPGARQPDGDVGRADREKGMIQPNPAGRNIRNVWTIASQAFAGSHFATFPPKLAEICIKAGSSEHGACPACGAPWRRVVTKGEPDMAHRLASGADTSGGYSGKSAKGHAAAGVQDASAVKARILEGMRERKSEWVQGCECRPAPPKRCVVLDPFGGAEPLGWSLTVLAGTPF